MVIIMQSIAANVLIAPHTSMISGEYVPKNTETRIAASCPRMHPAFSENVVGALSYFTDCFNFLVIVQTVPPHKPVNSQRIIKSVVSVIKLIDSSLSDIENGHALFCQP